MKTNRFEINRLYLCYAFFSLAVFNIGTEINFFTWSTVLLLYMGIYIIFVTRVFDTRKLKPLCNLVILIYVIYLMSNQVCKMWNYMKLYHGQTSAASTVAVSILIIIMLGKMKSADISKLYLPLTALTVLLISIVFYINITKVSRYNIGISDRYTGNVLNITLFDFIIPYMISLSSAGSSRKKSADIFVISTFGGLFTVVLFAFMCIKGNLLYSISPLQILFQISSTRLIRNFDALFNYLLYFSYIASLTALTHAYRIIKSNFNYFGKWDLLLIIPFFIMNNIIDYIPLLLVEAVMVTVMFFGKEKKSKYEKVPD